MVLLRRTTQGKVRWVCSYHKEKSNNNKDTQHRITDEEPHTFRNRNSQMCFTRSQQTAASSNKTVINRITRDNNIKKLHKQRKSTVSLPNSDMENVMSQNEDFERA
ncbi:hypothetical protein L596_028585 [Steinernema carpocapsae]|uniref:Uncharacterized protein n=1 Tax=Steinernema carpocapsae TaxID=34508 RepID=A0A4U5LYU6_STECR|nr:hypothetical protein L596_028585 [Steinernema carpocapsae]